VSPVRYELGFYIPEDGTLHSHLRENLKSFILVFSLMLGEELCEQTTGLSFAECTVNNVKL
jgi:hypothetical protein